LSDRDTDHHISFQGVRYESSYMYTALQEMALSNGLYFGFKKIQSFVTAQQQ